MGKEDKTKWSAPTPTTRKFIPILSINHWFELLSKLILSLSFVTEDFREIL